MSPPGPRRRHVATALTWAGDKRWPLSLLFFLTLLAGWEGAAWLGRLPSYLLPPSEIVTATYGLLERGILPTLVGASLRRSLAGFAIGAGLGVLLGLAAGVSPLVEDLIDRPISATYAVPKVALFPPLAVWLGFTDQTRIIVIAMVCLYPAYLNAYSGTRSIEPTWVWVARNAESSWLRSFTQVVLPAALPRVLVGVRISLALSFVMLFATEVIGFGDGLGAHLYRAYLDGRFDEMYAGIVVLGLLGFAADRIFAVVGSTLTRGQDVEAVGRA